MTFTLTKRTLRLWQLRTAAVTVLLSAALLVGRTWYFAVIAAATASVGAVIILVYLPLYCKGWRLNVNGTAVEVESGVIIRVNHIMPYPRMIYTNCYATPLGRLMGLEGLVLKAARGRLFLPELDREQIDKVLQYIGDN